LLRNRIIFIPALGKNFDAARLLLLPSHIGSQHFLKRTKVNIRAEVSSPSDFMWFKLVYSKYKWKMYWNDTVFVSYKKFIQVKHQCRDRNPIGSGPKKILRFLTLGISYSQWGKEKQVWKIVYCIKKHTYTYLLQSPTWEICKVLVQTEV
jgi:hypothetical protein